MKYVLKGSLILSVLCHTSAFAGVADIAREELYTTSTRIANYEYELTSDITIVNESMIAASGARTVAEALQQFAGVYVYDRSTPKTTVVDIRGFGDSAASNVLVLVNDRKLNSVDLSGPDLLQIPLGAVARIEILRGAGSVLYGDNAVGGVINVITKEGEGDPHAEVTYQYGSYERSKVSGQVSGRSDGLRYYGYAAYDDDKGYRDQSDVLARNFNTRLSYDFEGKANVDFEIGGHRDQTQLPGGLDEAELNGYGRRGAADRNFSETEDWFARLGFDYELGDTPGSLGAFTFDATYKNRDVFDSFFRTFNSTRRIDQWGFLGKYIFDREIFGHDVDFVLGLDLYETENDILGSGTNTDDITISKNEIGVYTFAELETFDNIFFNSGFRYQKAEYDFDDRGNSAFSSQDPDEWAWLAGFKWSFMPRSNIYGNIQKTFRFLATDEWYSTFSGLNTNLDQQKGVQYEIGIKQRVNSVFQYSVTPYLIEIDDEIYYDPSTFSNSNYEQTRRFGIETMGFFNLLPLFENKHLNRFDIRLGHTYQDPEFNGGVNDGRVIPLVPNHQFSQQVVVKFFDSWILGLQGRTIGRRVIGNDLDNSQSKASSYFVMDARIAYEIKNIEIFIEVNNIFDEDYNTYEIEKSVFGNPAITRDVYPAADRNINIGCTVKFG